MNKILFSFLFSLSVGFVSAQDSIRYTYSLDTFGIDSFFLVETIVTPLSGLPRGTESLTPYYFTDTSQLTAFINVLKADSAVIQRQYDLLADQKYAWTYKISRLECLRDSVFLGRSCGTAIGARMVTAPPPVEEMKSQEVGYWIIYTTGKRAYIPPGEEPEANGTILNQDGTTTRYRKPKQVKL
jgi:hypothetical protein